MNANLEVVLPASAPEGLRLYLNVFPPQQEAAVVAEIERLARKLWTHPQPRSSLPPAHRETIAFGWRYNANTRGVSKEPPMPGFLVAVRDRCAQAAGLHAETFEQASITRYGPQAGIRWHTDALCFGPVILSLSLAADWHMDFNRGGHRIAVRVGLPRGSLLVMSGAARVPWRHRILPVKTVRYSVSFRSIVPVRQF